MPRFPVFYDIQKIYYNFGFTKTKANNNQLKPGFLGINEVTRGSSMQFQECFELNRLLKQKSVCIEQGHPETGFSQIT